MEAILNDDCCAIITCYSSHVFNAKKIVRKKLFYIIRMLIKKSYKTLILKKLKMFHGIHVF